MGKKEKRAATQIQVPLVGIMTFDTGGEGRKTISVVAALICGRMLPEPAPALVTKWKSVCAVLLNSNSFNYQWRQLGLLCG